MSPLILDVSLWSADLVNLASEIQCISSYADSFHIDVADGHFAPNLLFFPDLVSAIRKSTPKPLHVHLMVSHPVSIVGRFIEAGADLISIHVESDRVAEGLTVISSAGLRSGLAIRLDTPVEALREYVGKVDHVISMGTHLGVKGADLAPEACDRMRAIRRLFDRGSETKLYADGGIRRDSVPRLREAGTDAIVPGSLIFQADDKEATHRWLKSL
jgi:ribulose-phosphate 3-epimerase